MYVLSLKSIFRKLIYYIIFLGISIGTLFSPVWGQLDSATIEANTFFIPDSVTLNERMTWGQMIFIFEKIFILEDSIGGLTIQDITSKFYNNSFYPNKTKFDGTNPTSYYWARIYLKGNNLPFQEYVFGLPAYCEYIDLYEKKQENFNHIYSGGFKRKHLDFSRVYDDISIRIKPNETKVFYLRLKPSHRFDYNNSINMQVGRNAIALRIMALNPNQSFNGTVKLYTQIFAVIFIFMGLYHLVLYYLSKDQSYLYFSIALFFAVFYLNRFSLLFLFFSDHWVLIFWEPLVFTGFYLGLFFFSTLPEGF